MRPSILYAAGADNPSGPLADHRFVVDLNLDQIFAAVNAGREQLDLAVRLLRSSGPARRRDLPS